MKITLKNKEIGFLDFLKDNLVLDVFNSIIELFNIPIQELNESPFNYYDLSIYPNSKQILTTIMTDKAITVGDVLNELDNLIESDEDCNRLDEVYIDTCVERDVILAGDILIIYWAYYITLYNEFKEVEFVKKVMFQDFESFAYRFNIDLESIIKDTLQKYGIQKIEKFVSESAILESIDNN